MRYFCWTCHKSVSSELPDDSVLRAICICPECIEQKKVLFETDKADIIREIAHKAGSTKSVAKAAAARENGKKGGRPRAERSK